MSSTPDSVLSRHLSPPKRAVFGLHGVTGPCQHRCDANERHDPNGLPLSLAVARPTHLALHGSAQSPSHAHCCCMLVRFYRTVSALTCARRPSAGMLAVVGLRQCPVTQASPLLAVSQGDLASREVEESGSSSSLRQRRHSSARLGWMIEKAGAVVKCQGFGIRGSGLGIRD